MEKAEIIEMSHFSTLEQFEFKINHFRNYDKKKILNHGGYTVITFVRNGKPYSMVSRCSANDAYEKDIGIYECFKRYAKRVYNRRLFMVDKDVTGTYMVFLSAEEDQKKD
jgi:hypothetical protein